MLINFSQNSYNPRIIEEECVPELIGQHGGGFGAGAVRGA
jgi:hypothetical protein